MKVRQQEKHVHLYQSVLKTPAAVQVGALDPGAAHPGVPARGAGGGGVGHAQARSVPSQWWDQAEVVGLSLHPEREASATTDHTRAQTAPN